MGDGAAVLEVADNDEFVKTPLVLVRLADVLFEGLPVILIVELLDVVMLPDRLAVREEVELLPDIVTVEVVDAATTVPLVTVTTDAEADEVPLFGRDCTVAKVVPFFIILLLVSTAL